ncbi:MAG: hypothetical protein DSZ08_08455 [Sulfurovum sp.]|nr:MAG: hypothetical protein DSZ08_08455 [Sulfurovum sp.]
MKDKTTQAIALEKMMQACKPHFEYELALPFFEIKNTNLQSLTKDDVLLLGLDTLQCNLLYENKIYANVVLYQEKFEITNIYKTPINKYNTKKYDTLKCSFGTFKKNKLKVGNRLNLETLNLKEVTLFLNHENIAQGSLVNVDNTIAIQINKVNRYA